MFAFFRRLFTREAPDRKRRAPPSAPPAHKVTGAELPASSLAPPPAPSDYLSFADYSREERAARLAAEAVGNTRARELARLGAQRMVDQLPPFPAVANQVFAVLQNQNSRATDIAAVVNRDPAMAASVLRLAASAMYASDKPVATVRDAVVRLGYDEVARVASSVAASALFDRKTVASREFYRDAFDDLWNHALATAFASASFAVERGTCDPNEAFLAALMHDIGKTIALDGLAIETSRRLDGGEEGTSWIHRSEVTPILDELHTELGVSVATHWNLPSYVREVVRWMHVPVVPTTDCAPLVHTVRVISGLNRIRIDPGHPAHTHDEVRTSAAALRLDDRALTNIAATLRQSAAKAAALHHNVQ